MHILIVTNNFEYSMFHFHNRETFYIKIEDCQKIVYFSVERYVNQLQLCNSYAPRGL